jgi:hypothetical protein
MHANRAGTASIGFVAMLEMIAAGAGGVSGLDSREGTAGFCRNFG